MTKRSMGTVLSRPYIDMVIPSLTDPSVAPPGKHVMSCFVQYAPYKLAPGLDWDTEKEKFGDTVDQHDCRICPEYQGHHSAPAGRNASRSRTRIRIERRQHLPGRTLAGATVLSASGAGWAQYRTPIKNLYMCGSATHPGGGIMGANGRLAASRNSERREGGGLTMPETRDVVIIGGGHNGLVTAFYLAKAGFKPLVLERRAQVGGAAITEEFHPGFRAPCLAHNAGPLRADIVRDMQLAKHGLKFDNARSCGASLAARWSRVNPLQRSEESSRRKLRKFSQKDATRYSRFSGIALDKIGKVIGQALALTPPNIDNPSSWRPLVHAEDRPRHPQSRQERHVSRPALGADGRSPIWSPSFSISELLRATVAARGIFGTFLARGRPAARWSC